RWPALAVAASAAVWWIRGGALPPALLDLEERTSTEGLARDGEPPRESPSAPGLRSRPLPPHPLPPAPLRAPLAAEDARFFSHPGVDPLALARALGHDLRAMRMVEGGSTLTQQTVKVLIHRDRSAGGKLRELLLALRLEHRLSKREILALY